MARRVKNAVEPLPGKTGPQRVFWKWWNRIPPLLALGAVLLALAPHPAYAAERTVFGKIVRLDAADRTLTVQDRKGTMWNYAVDRDADISLGDFEVGDTVSVTIGRPTPLNMVTAADRLRKGDRVTKIPF